MRSVPVKQIKLCAKTYVDFFFETEFESKRNFKLIQWIIVQEGG